MPLDWKIAVTAPPRSTVISAPGSGTVGAAALETRPPRVPAAEAGARAKAGLVAAPVVTVTCSVCVVSPPAGPLAVTLYVPAGSVTVKLPLMSDVTAPGVLRNVAGSWPSLWVGLAPVVLVTKTGTLGSGLPPVSRTTPVTVPSVLVRPSVKSAREKAAAARLTTCETGSWPGAVAVT